ncbi:MAG: Rrf2 family transcriptional regulator [Propionibacteriaceae bacterium]
MLAKTDYALRAVVSLANAQDQCLSSQAIATEQQIPQSFLERILTDLRRAGVVTSRRGIRGGYQLAIPPGDLNLAAVINAVDPDFLRRPEPAGSVPGSGGDAVDALWAAMEADLQRRFEGMTLQDLVEP